MRLKGVLVPLFLESWILRGTLNESSALRRLTFVKVQHLPGSHFDLSKRAFPGLVGWVNLVDSGLTGDTPVGLTNSG